jgi:hypothetical protein
MNNVLNFILKSSADPKATSATIKFALLGVIPYLMQAAGIVCGFDYICIDLNPSTLELIASTVADTAYYLLSLVSVVGALWGASRKLYRTLTGENEVLNSRV